MSYIYVRRREWRIFGLDCLMHCMIFKLDKRSALLSICLTHCMELYRPYSGYWVFTLHLLLMYSVSKLLVLAIRSFLLSRRTRSLVITYSWFYDIIVCGNHWVYIRSLLWFLLEIRVIFSLDMLCYRFTQTIWHRPSCVTIFIDRIISRSMLIIGLYSWSIPRDQARIRRGALCFPHILIRQI